MAAVVAVPTKKRKLTRMPQKSRPRFKVCLKRGKYNSYDRADPNLHEKLRENFSMLWTYQHADDAIPESLADTLIEFK